MARNNRLPIEMIAAICHEANRRLCTVIGDASQEPWETAPGWARESAWDGVVKILDGRVNEPRDSHASWMAHKLAEGWKYGEIKNPEAKEHPCLVPFDELPIAQQLKDYVFFGIVCALSEEVIGARVVSPEQEAEDKRIALRLIHFAQTERLIQPLASQHEAADILMRGLAAVSVHRGGR